jgi:hypothetical protein
VGLPGEGSGSLLYAGAAPSTRMKGAISLGCQLGWRARLWLTIVTDAEVERLPLMPVQVMAFVIGVGGVYKGGREVLSP